MTRVYGAGGVDAASDGFGDPSQPAGVGALSYFLLIFAPSRTATAYQIRDDQISYVDYPGHLTGDPVAIVNGQDTCRARWIGP